MLSPLVYRVWQSQGAKLFRGLWKILEDPGLICFARVFQLASTAVAFDGVVVRSGIRRNKFLLI